MNLFKLALRLRQSDVPAKVAFQDFLKGNAMGD
jgi:hypothetical protein